MEEVSNALSYTEQISIMCYYSVSDAIAGDGGSVFTFSNIGTNILYNAGYMYQDMWYLFTEDPDDHDDDWYYFAGDLLGDFVMRFFYSSG